MRGLELTCPNRSRHIGLRREGHACRCRQERGRHHRSRPRFHPRWAVHPATAGGGSAPTMLTSYFATPPGPGRSSAGHRPDRGVGPEHRHAVHCYQPDRHPKGAVRDHLLRPRRRWRRSSAGSRGRLRKTRHRGTARFGWMFTLAATAYNMIRLPKLLAAA